MPLALALVLVPVLIAMNAFFVAAEYAVVAVRPAQIALMRQGGRLRAASAIERLKADPTSAIGSIQVCITMTNLLLGWIGEPAMSALLAMPFGPLIRWHPTLFQAISTALSFVVVTLLTVVFSELLPKSLTLRYAFEAALLTAVPVFAIQKIARPLVWVMNQLANTITRPLGLGRVEDLEKQLITRDELLTMTAEAASDGSLTPRETSVVLNSLSLARRAARQIKVPRTKVSYLDMQRSMEENRRILNEHLFTRLPLCDGGMDHVIGVVHTKEFLAAYNAEGDTSVLSLIARPAVYVPEQLPLDKVLSVFHEQKTQMVFLMDEYGGVEGIVTLQDVMDELVGQVSESSPASDANAQSPKRQSTADNQPLTSPLILPGDTPLHDLAQLLNKPNLVASNHAVTLNGLIVGQISRIPLVGEQIEVEGIRFNILESDGRAVRRVEVIDDHSKTLLHHAQ